MKNHIFSKIQSISLIFLMRNILVNIIKINISILLTLGASQSIAEVLKFKSATQINTDWGGNPERAIDGNSDGNYDNGSVTHTNKVGSWWQGELRRKSVIKTIKIFNRTGCCTERLANFYILVSSDDMSQRSLTSLLNDRAVSWVYVSSPVGRFSLHNNFDALGKYVMVRFKDDNPNPYLSLAEVVVAGLPQVPFESATQSSVRDGGFPGAAIDGNTSGNYWAGSTTHTDNVGAWWQGKLAYGATLGAIKIYNRTDCCWERLANFYILVSDLDMSAMTLSQALASNEVHKYKVGETLTPAGWLLWGNGVRMPGRYVQIRFADNNPNPYLSLSEVQVFGLSDILIK